MGGPYHRVIEYEEWLPTSMETQQDRYLRQEEIALFHCVRFEEFSKIDCTCSHTKLKLYNNLKAGTMQPGLGLFISVCKTINRAAPF